jgi:hypothetical protein
MIYVHIIIMYVCMYMDHEEEKRFLTMIGRKTWGSGAGIFEEQVTAPMTFTGRKLAQGNSNNAQVL